LIADAIARARELADEVIVVDGRSGDGTPFHARAAGAKVIATAKGRGIQLHAGARAARGDVLLFLHADARLPATAREAILQALADPAVIGGNFLIEFLPQSWCARALAQLNDARRKLMRRYYGDSAIFIRRDAYHALGGFKPWPLMEDYEFSGRMENAGRCAYIREVPVLASARRFRGREIRVLLLWTLILMLYWIGVPPRLLALAYRGRRADDPDAFLRAYRLHRQREHAAPAAQLQAGE
jgi:rSAM/selenodomain-associated transferase 2